MYTVSSYETGSDANASSPACLLLLLHDVSSQDGSFHPCHRLLLLRLRQLPVSHISTTHPPSISPLYNHETCLLAAAAPPSTLAASATAHVLVIWPTSSKGTSTTPDSPREAATKSSPSRAFAPPSPFTRSTSKPFRTLNRTFHTLRARQARLERILTSSKIRTSCPLRYPGTTNRIEQTVRHHWHHTQ